jgi:hypothetical protein
MINLERIKSMNDIEMAEFIEGIQSDCDASGYIGCSHCSAYGTHHSDKSYLGTAHEHLYECKDCEFEEGLIAWLNREVEAGGTT